MSNHITSRAFLRGIRDGAPFVVVILPFGMLFGVAASEAGWNFAQVLAMSVLVIAGASQFTAIQMLSDHAPLAIVVLTALAVNLRLAMYSASLAPLIGTAPFWQRALVAYMLTDQNYGTTMADASRPDSRTTAEHVAHFFGATTAIVPLWVASSVLGAVAGSGIPPALALDFAVPITFIALVAPLLRSLPHLAAAFVSVAVALTLVELPYNFGLLIAAILAMSTGATVEYVMERRK